MGKMTVKASKHGNLARCKARGWKTPPFFNLMGRLQRWLVDWISPTDFLPEDFRFFLEKGERIYHKRGKRGFIQHCKQCRVFLLSTLSDGSYLSSPGGNLRRRLKPFFGGALVRKLLLNRTPDNIRVLLTAASMSKALKLPPEPDFGPVVNPPSVDPKSRRYAGLVKRFWRELGFPRRPGWADLQVHWSEYHFTTKSGPNGHALMGCLSDLSSLPDGIIESVKAIGGVKLSQGIDLLRPLLGLFTEMGLAVEKPRWPRRLVGIRDMEGKTRVVAIFDYWSQTALHPVHSFLFRVLRRIPQDCTFDQGKLQERVEGWDDPTFYSVDLTAATDRFPISVIAEVLLGAFSPGWVSHWKNLMVGLPFDAPQKGGTDRVSYSVGNPMGAYSSWSSFALAHHFVVFVSCKRAGVPWSKSRYCLLGDDIVIGDPRIGEFYLEEVRSLGLEVSLAKTHVSKEMFEFAKRISFRGREVTPFNPSAISGNLQKYPLLVAALSGEERKGFLFSGKVPRSVSELYRLVEAPSRFRKGILRKAELCELATLTLQSRVAPHFFVSEVVRDGLGLPEGHAVREDVSDNILRAACVQLFMEAQTRFREGDFGQSFEGLAEFLTETVGPASEPEVLLDSLPFLAIVRRVHETAQKVQEETMGVLMEDGRLWEFITSMAIPMGDHVFQQRQHETLRMVSSALRSKVLEVATLNFQSLDDPMEALTEISPESPHWTETLGEGKPRKPFLPKEGGSHGL